MGRQQKIVLIEPFYSGSHKTWADALIKYSSHHIELLALPGKHWKWRMHGAAVKLADDFKKLPYQPDRIVISSMMDVPLFLGLIRKIGADIPVAVYFHESQFRYPVSPNDTDVRRGRDNHYAFMNYTAALAADKVFFNSSYHRTLFLDEASTLLSAMPDHKSLDTIQLIREKSEVLYIGLDLIEQSDHPKKDNQLSILWNHRWEHDKNPEGFLRLMKQLSEQRDDIQLILLGQDAQLPKEVQQLKNDLSDITIVSGYAASKDQYMRYLKIADVLPVTSYHDFFGISVAEAIHAGAIPFLPHRLSYPELIPKELHKNYLYHSEEELLQRLIDIKLPKQSTSNLIQHIRHFSWEQMIVQYDRALTTF